MNKIEFEYPQGATALDPDELNGLIPTFVSTQGELNTVEKENIKEATVWVHGKNHKNILNVKFLYGLHKKMLGEVWTWAGEQRTSAKNIGVDWQQIPTQLHELLQNTKYWIGNKTYSWDEIAARFHYKLVEIHVFPNGNGRHARLMTDILMEANGQKQLSWGTRGSSDIIDVEGELRNEYISALQEADFRKYNRLIKFMRS